MSDELKAGRELDALVAEHVMGNHGYIARCVSDHLNADDTRPTSEIGWMLPEDDARRIAVLEGEGWDVVACAPQCYSQDIAAAWEVVEKMNAPPINWHFFVSPDGEVRASSGGESFVMEADTAPEAICKAALLTCGYDPEEP